MLTQWRKYDDGILNETHSPIDKITKAEFSWNSNRIFYVSETDATHWGSLSWYWRRQIELIILRQENNVSLLDNKYHSVHFSSGFLLFMMVIMKTVLVTNHNPSHAVLWNMETDLLHLSRLRWHMQFKSFLEERPIHPI